MLQSGKKVLNRVYMPCQAYMYRYMSGISCLDHVPINVELNLYYVGKDTTVVLPQWH